MEATATKEKKLTRSNFGPRGWALILLCLGGGFMSSAMSGSLNLSTTYFSGLYGWSQTQMMWGSTMGTIVAVIISLFAGKLLINRSPRRVIMILSVVFAACFLLNGFSVNLAMFYITVIVATGSGWMWALFCGPNLIANWFPRKTGLAMGWVTMGMPLGAGVAANVMRAVFTRVGFHASYIPYTVSAVILGLLTLLVLKDFPSECGCYPDNDKDFDEEQMKKEEAEVKLAREKSPWKPKRILQTKEFWFLWVSIAFMTFCTGFMAQVVPTLMSYGMEMTAATYCMLLVCAIACVGSFLLGKVDAVFGSKQAMFVGVALVFAMAIFPQFNFLACKLIGFCFVGAVMGGSSNFLLAMCMKLWGPLNCMSVYRFGQPLIALVQSFGATIIAWVAALAGGNYNMSFLMMGVLGVISLILIIFVRPAGVKKKEETFLEEDRKAAAASTAAEK